MVETHECEKIQEWNKDLWTLHFHIMNTKEGWGLLVPGVGLIQIEFCPVCGIKLNGVKKTG